MNRMVLSFRFAFARIAALETAVEAGGTLAGSSKGKVKSENQPLTFQ
jgi:hypothetical protein